ncbi:MAG TPA: thiamine pyrophosphate-dependent dehydrogenase E1 component subunit alpha, partial [Longimicrobiales bacterium]|nr:thiamine pyrophosphate-dependent dehydrogenase E1 component subunit alpha [Longimicrobiales bacterium]
MTSGSGAEGREGAFRFLELLLTTRGVEERLEALQRRGLVTGGLYRSLGQEAGPVGVALALERRDDGTGDVIAPSYRGCGAGIAFGASVEETIRQFAGRASAPSGGRDGGVGWSDLERGILGPVAPLGTMVEIMGGVALGFRLRGEARVALVLTGDGSTSTGAWHEGLAFASARRCPLVVVIENNQWAFSTRTAERARGFGAMAPAYGVDVSSVDGTDVFAVHAAACAAVARARAGEGVQLLEVRTFRRSGHAQHDALEYVDETELAEWARRDPIEKLRARILAEGWGSEDELDA